MPKAAGSRWKKMLSKKNKQTITQNNKQHKLFYRKDTMQQKE